MFAASAEPVRVDPLTLNVDVTVFAASELTEKVCVPDALLTVTLAAGATAETVVTPGVAAKLSVIVPAPVGTSWISSTFEIFMGV
jgi:hypothetical protein